jgi:hypothetical protein
MYKEAKVLHNDRDLEQQSPNGPLVPGHTHVVTERHWNRIDAQVEGHLENGKLVLLRQGNGYGQLPYADLVGLTTPERVLYYEAHPTGSFGLDLDALLEQYVLPPDVQAAIFRAIAQSADAHAEPDAVNVDGRPAVGLRITTEGYRSEELLFDKTTYDLIGERTVVIAEHTLSGLGSTVHYHRGDVLNQRVYTASRIVDDVGDVD